jgi:hypothetical protein
LRGKQGTGRVPGMIVAASQKKRAACSSATRSA